MKQLIIIAAVLLLASCEKEADNVLRYEAKSECGAHITIHDPQVNQGGAGDLFVVDDNENWSKEFVRNPGDRAYIRCGQMTTCYKRIAIYYEGELLQEVITQGPSPEIDMTIP